MTRPRLLLLVIVGLAVITGIATFAFHPSRVHDDSSIAVRDNGPGFTFGPSSSLATCGGRSRALGRPGGVIQVGCNNGRWGNYVSLYMFARMLQMHLDWPLVLLPCWQEYAGFPMRFEGAHILGVDEKALVDYYTRVENIERVPSHVTKEQLDVILANCTGRLLTVFDYHENYAFFRGLRPMAQKYLLNWSGSIPSLPLPQNDDLVMHVRRGDIAKQSSRKAGLLPGKHHIPAPLEYYTHIIDRTSATKVWLITDSPGDAVVVAIIEYVKHHGNMHIAYVTPSYPSSSSKALPSEHSPKSASTTQMNSMGSEVHALVDQVHKLEEHPLRAPTFPISISSPSLSTLKRDAVFYDWMIALSASELAISPSSFSWWAGYIGRARRIHYPVIGHFHFKNNHHTLFVVDDDERYVYQLVQAHVPFRFDLSYEELIRIPSAELF
eukprot:TRINITY_DN13654_c0_g1_i1.p1 TRINITY_DN13654_c0_g1~~TRINITY_DN13654_c0_g1_i1.p1  ORF type:complete len:438 (+),score=56.96 TRINITY_DN13654_c0_g1_i1:420-1733(+)